MKRAISLSFILLANIILLAHAVIPHHHHDTIPVVIISHHEHDRKAHEHHHHHDDNEPVNSCDASDSHAHNGFEDCILANLFFRLENERQEFQTVNCDFGLLLWLSPLLSGYELPPIINDTGLPFRQHPLQPSYFTDYISQSLGLRAPPYC